MNARGMMVSLLRRSVRPIFAISKPSMRIRPSTGSTNRKNDSARVLFPDPVRPRMPTFSPGRTSNERWCSTLGRSGCPIVSRLRQGPHSRRQRKEERTAYRMTRSSHWITPLVGHDAGGRGSRNSGGSRGSSENSLTRSTATCRYLSGRSR